MHNKNLTRKLYREEMTWSEHCKAYSIDEEFLEYLIERGLHPKPRGYSEWDEEPYFHCDDFDDFTGRCPTDIYGDHYKESAVLGQLKCGQHRMRQAIMDGEFVPPDFIYVQPRIELGFDRREVDKFLESEEGQAWK